MVSYTDAKDKLPTVAINPDPKLISQGNLP